jgi:hypothetical protein
VSDEVKSALGEIAVDRNNLYREESYTDLKVATIRVLTPVTLDGAADPSREPLFIAQTQLMSQAGPLPVQTSIDAKSLTEALAKFPEAEVPRSDQEGGRGNDRGGETDPARGGVAHRGPGPIPRQDHRLSGGGWARWVNRSRSSVWE